MAIIQRDLTPPAPTQNPARGVRTGRAQWAAYRAAKALGVGRHHPLWKFFKNKDSVQLPDLRRQVEEELAWLTDGWPTGHAMTTQEAGRLARDLETVAAFCADPEVLPW